MIRNHICSSFNASRVEVLEEESSTPGGCFNADIDRSVPAENIFGLAEKAYRDEGFFCNRIKERKDLDGSVCVHLEVQSAGVRRRIVMLRQGEFFSFITFNC